MIDKQERERLRQTTAPDTVLSVTLSRQQVAGLLDEIDRLERELHALRAAAALPHLYEGGCPDDTQPRARDPLCPACQTMILAAQDVPADSGKEG